jgi:hypothetical protein
MEEPLTPAADITSPGLEPGLESGEQAINKVSANAPVASVEKRSGMVLYM